MWQPALYPDDRPRNRKLQSSEVQEKQIGIYGSLKFLSKKFSHRPFSYKTLARFYEVSLNLDGSLEKEIPNQEDTMERVSETIFILDTLGVSELKTKRIEGLCDKLLHKDDVAVSVLVLLLELTDYKTIQEREQESSLERFFTRKNHRRTITLSKDILGNEIHSDLTREPRDVSKSYWRHRRILSLQPDKLAQSTRPLEEVRENIRSSDSLSPRSHRSRRSDATSHSSSFPFKDSGEEFAIEEKEPLEKVSSALPKSIFDFSDKMYQAVYRKHFGSRSKSWIPPNHPLIFDTARWSLISNVSYLIRRNPLGGFEPVASRLQPCARNLLAEFATVATELFEMERTISILKEKNHPILQGFAKALSDEVNRYDNNILPLVRKTSYKVHLHENESLPIFGLMQEARKVTAEVHECVVIMKAVMPSGEIDPYKMLRKLYEYQRDHFMTFNRESLCGRLFLKVLIAYLFALRRIALYGNQLSVDSDEDTFLPSAAQVVIFPKVFENMFPMKVKFMVDKAAYAVDILWSVNPQHPFFSSNRDSLCAIPSFDSVDIEYLEKQVEEHFSSISKELMDSCMDKKVLDHHAFVLNAEPCGDEHCSLQGDDEKKYGKNQSDDELSWLSSESEDPVEISGLSGEYVARSSSIELNKSSNHGKVFQGTYFGNMPDLWESSGQARNEFVKDGKMDIPFEKFVSDLALVSIRGIYYYVQQYLWWLMEERIAIFDHFRSVCDYLLLNRGDFFLELCHSIYNISSSEWFMGGTEAEARLQLAFEQAILSSSAASDPRIRNFEFSMDKEGNTDSAHVFHQILLQWRPSNLVESALFDSSTMEIYSHIFHFAFKLKNVSYLLRQLYSSIASFPSHLQGLQRRAHILRFQLMQFINALLQFYEHGLLEGNWFRFLLQAKKCNDIWQLRNLHLQFLEEALSYIFRDDNPLAPEVNQIIDEIIDLEIDARRALRKSNVSNISNFDRRMQGLSCMLHQFYDRILLSDKKMKVKSTEWATLMTYFGIHAE